MSSKPHDRSWRRSCGPLLAIVMLACSSSELQAVPERCQTQAVESQVGAADCFAIRPGHLRGTLWHRTHFKVWADVAGEERFVDVDIPDGTWHEVFATQSGRGSDNWKVEALPNGLQVRDLKHGAAISIETPQSGFDLVNIFQDGETERFLVWYQNPGRDEGIVGLVDLRIEEN